MQLAHSARRQVPKAVRLSFKFSYSANRPSRRFAMLSAPLHTSNGVVKVIGTHNGTFHADEALAVYLLRQLPIYSGADLVRTRDPTKLDACDIVVDVGAVYDASKLRYDHHQRGFTEVFGHGFNTKLSSAGLIYKHYGREIISRRLGVSADDPKADVLYLKLYREFIEAIDGIDNGINQYSNELKPAYRMRTDLSSRVGFLNPAWNEPATSEVYDAQFAKASVLTGTEFMNRLDHYAKAWFPARDLVVQAIKVRSPEVSDPRLLLLEKFAPWKEHLFDLEEELKTPEAEKTIYVVYPDETGGNWRVQAVPVSPESFESRKALPEPWRGVRDDELSKSSGIDGCIFVHASGFIGGNKTKDGALKMVSKALTL